jgi:hypothetical protein
MALLDTYRNAAPAQGARTQTPRQITPDGGEITSRGTVIFRIFGKRQPDGSLTIQGAANPRAVLSFSKLVTKAKSDLERASAGELKDILGEVIQPERYDLKLCSINLGPGTNLRIGSVTQMANNDLSIALVKAGKNELPVLPDATAIPSFDGMACF